MKIVIIGNDAAAINAVETIRSMDRNSEIVMVSEEALPAYSCSLLPFYISNENKKRNLFLKDMDFYKAMKIATRFGIKAVKVNPDEKDG